MMTAMASMPRMVQGGGRGGGTGMGPHTRLQSWHEHGSDPSGRDSLQPRVALVIGVMPATGASVQSAGHAVTDIFKAKPAPPPKSHQIYDLLKLSKNATNNWQQRVLIEWPFLWDQKHTICILITD